MSAAPFHYRFHGDALTGYMTLTLEERGAYTTILDMIYDRGGPIPAQERLISGYLNVSLRKTRTLLQSLIEKGKIYRTEDGFIGNPRADREIAKAKEKSRKHAENGAKGGYKKAENAKKDNEINDGDLAEPQHIPLSTIHSDTNVSGADAPDVDFAKALFENGVKFLMAHGGSEQSARSLIGRWRKSHEDSEVFNAFKAAKAAGATDPKSYIAKILGGSNGKPASKADRLQRTIAAAAAGSSHQDWG